MSIQSLGKKRSGALLFISLLIIISALWLNPLAKQIEPRGFRAQLGGQTQTLFTLTLAKRSDSLSDINAFAYCASFACFDTSVWTVPFQGLYRAIFDAFYAFTYQQGLASDPSTWFPPFVYDSDGDATEINFDADLWSNYAVSFIDHYLHDDAIYYEGHGVDETINGERIRALALVSTDWGFVRDVTPEELTLFAAQFEIAFKEKLLFEHPRVAPIVQAMGIPTLDCGIIENQDCFGNYFFRFFDPDQGQYAFQVDKRFFDAIPDEYRPKFVIAAACDALEVPSVANLGVKIGYVECPAANFWTTPDITKFLESLNGERGYGVRSIRTAANQSIYTWWHPTIDIPNGVDFVFSPAPDTDAITLKCREDLTGEIGKEGDRINNTFELTVPWDAYISDAHEDFEVNCLGQDPYFQCSDANVVIENNNNNYVMKIRGTYDGTIPQGEESTQLIGQANILEVRGLLNPQNPEQGFNFGNGRQYSDENDVCVAAEYPNHVESGKSFNWDCENNNFTIPDPDKEPLACTIVKNTSEPGGGTTPGGGSRRGGTTPPPTMSPDDPTRPDQPEGPTGGTTPCSEDRQCGTNKICVAGECVQANICGNGRIESPEECEGGSGAATCLAFGTSYQCVQCNCVLPESTDIGPKVLP